MSTKTKIWAIATYSNGSMKTTRNYTNREAFCRWANNQYNKDEGVTIEEYHMDENFESTLYCTWHA